MQDIFLEIATAESKNALHWTNVNVKWTQLVSKCMTRFNTHETFAVFMAADPEFKTKQKDVGAFVSGYLQGGSRAKGAVMFKQLVTLDADYTSNDPGFLDRIKSMPFTLTYYTTHSHSPANPRYRILIPLDRPATVEEYEPIARRIAEALGIENMDRTSYELNRLMFWPSTSIDGVFDSGFVQGPYVSADAVLASYRDYKDSSAWPRAQGESIAIRSEVGKLGDPALKPGIIGAFCQVFDAETCVEELLGAYYTRSDTMPDRFTYNFSSTSNGLVFYDGYAFSHHSSDPAGTGHPHNAFDLMRIHLFGEAEDNMAQPMGKRKSFLLAQDYAMSIPEVKALMTEKSLSAREEFVDLALFGIASEVQAQPGLDTPAPGAAFNTEWRSKFITDKQGKPLSTPHNIGLIFQNDPVVKGCFAYDEFANRLVLKNRPAWRKNNDGHEFKDIDDSFIRSYFETMYGISGKEKLIDGLDIEAYKSGYHPVRSYLESLVWDGVSRIDFLFNAFLGAEDSEYTRQVSRKWFTAAVARVFSPGIKFDNMIIFVGEEGIGKSTLVSKLGGEWFSDTSIDLRNKKESMEDLQGVWIMEWAELTSFRTASVEAVKAFVSKGFDRFRAAYGRRVEKYARQCIFMGSTNIRDFLSDPDGNRRFWPVLTQVVPITADVHSQLTEEVRGQVWAEAVAMFRAGEPLNLSKELIAVAKQVQKAHTESDDRLALIDSYIEMLIPTEWYNMSEAERIVWLTSPGNQKGPNLCKRPKICAAEIWVDVFQGDRKNMDRMKMRFIHNHLKNLRGWEPFASTTSFGVFGHQKGYSRIV